MKETFDYIVSSNKYRYDKEWIQHISKDISRDNPLKILSAKINEGRQLLQSVFNAG